MDLFSSFFGQKIGNFGEKITDMSKYAWVD